MEVERRFSGPVRIEWGWENLKKGEPSWRDDITSRRENTGAIRGFLRKNGQAWLPLVEQSEQAEVALDELIDVLGRATVEMVLRLSAARIAGPPHPGKQGGAVGWPGREEGTGCRKERKLRGKRSRLRRKGQGEDGEVPIPAYEVLRADPKLGSRMLAILRRGGCTRQYRAVLPAMAETVGVARSSVSREASEEELRRLGARRLQARELLIMYLDGVSLGDQHVLVAVGLDEEGKKPVRGVAAGASENQVVAKGLVEEVGRRGGRTERKYLFVIAGSKGLRAAIDAVFGAENAGQRCRHHQVENVMGSLPEHRKDQSKAAMRAAFRLPAREGMARLEKQAEWLEREYPRAAASLGAGLTEMFTVKRLGLSPSLSGCLVSTNVIESPHRGVRLRTRKICRWQDGPALGCRSAAHDRTEFPQD